MASGFPGSIDNFTDPLTTSALNSPSHAGQHQDLNDAVEKIETYMGLVKVIPTVASVGGTAATVSANGTITVGNGNTSITVTAFSALYDNYRIYLANGTCSASPQIRLQLVGIATGYYGALTSTIYTTSAFSGQNDNNSTLFSWVGWGTTNAVIADVDISGPFLAGQKLIHAKNVYNHATAAYGTYVGQCAVSNSSTGFILTPSTGSFSSGTIRVYGYRN